MTNLSSPVLIEPSTIHTRSLLMACDTPLLHPYLALRVSEQILIASGTHPSGMPRDLRKVVLAVTRTDGSERNGGRRWLNFDECSTPIAEFLNRRGKGERLEMFRFSMFKNMASLVHYWNKNVRAVVAVHGGGLYNVLWSSPDTIVVELRPQRHGHSYGGTVFWELSSLKNLTYWTIPIPAVDDLFNANANCSHIVRALHMSLNGHTHRHGLAHWYQGSFRPTFK